MVHMFKIISFQQCSSRSLSLKPLSSLLFSDRFIQTSSTLHFNVWRSSMPWFSRTSASLFYLYEGAPITWYSVAPVNQQFFTTVSPGQSFVHNTLIRTQETFVEILKRIILEKRLVYIGYTKTTHTKKILHKLNNLMKAYQ